MVKYTVENQESEDSPELKLSLVLQENGIIVVGTDEENTTWNLLAFLPDGTFSRLECVPDNIGLQVDDDGCIVEAIK